MSWWSWWSCDGAVVVVAWTVAVVDVDGVGAAITVNDVPCLADAPALDAAAA